MGRHCKICGRIRPNESFGGKGRRQYVCRDCRKRPKAEVERIEREDEICGFMEQSNISERNIQRLETLTRSELPGIADLASLVLAVARVKPHKRRRFKFLATRHRDLLDKLIQSGLFDGYVDEAIANMDDEEAEAFFHLGFDISVAGPDEALDEGMDFPAMGDLLIRRSRNPEAGNWPHPDPPGCEPDVVGRTEEVDSPQYMSKRPIVPGPLIDDEYEDRIALLSLDEFDQAEEIDDQAPWALDEITIRCGDRAVEAIQDGLDAAARDVLDAVIPTEDLDFADDR